MSTYAFEVMSPAQAASLVAGDHVVITSLTATTGNVAVSFVGTDITITSGGRALTFGAAFSSQVQSLRPAGQPAILVGTPGGDAITGQDVGGGAVPPPLTGGDLLIGGAGDDTLNGLRGSDTLSGGEGADVFVFDVTGGDVVTDFQAVDRLAFGLRAPLASAYLEGAFASVAAATTFATTEFGSGGATVLAAQVGGDVFVFWSASLANITIIGSTSAVGRLTLKGANLEQLTAANFIAAPAAAAAPTPAPPPIDAPPPPEVPSSSPSAPPAPSTVGTPGAVGTVHGDIDLLRFSDLRGARQTTATDADLVLDGAAADLTLHGSVLAYDVHGALIDGRAHVFTFDGAGVDIDVSIGVFGSIGLRLSPFQHWVASDANQAALAELFGGLDTLSGGAGGDLVRSYGGDDKLSGGGGADSLFGGAGNDVIYATAASGPEAQAASGGTYLRGDEGSDWIAGGSGFDDINGNMGNDTASGGAGSDWVVGGKDDDLLFGEDGDDLVYGNNGADTCYGGDGADTVRGGQGDDVVRGGAGGDFLSGDRGADTLTGGSGADVFHIFAEAGSDVVTDFNWALGDRVQLLRGAQYTVAQVGPDVEISLQGAKLTLAGVYLSTLGTGWIFGA